MRPVYFLLAVILFLIHGFDAILFLVSVILFLALWYWLARMAQIMIWRY